MGIALRVRDARRRNQGDARQENNSDGREKHFTEGLLPTASCRLPTAVCLLLTAYCFLVEAPGIEPGSKSQRRRTLHAYLFLFSSDLSTE